MYQIATNLGNDHKCTKWLYVIYSKWPYNIPTFSIPRPQKFTQIVIFGLKIFHLATLISGGNNCSKVPTPSALGRLEPFGGGKLLFKVESDGTKCRKSNFPKNHHFLSPQFSFDKKVVKAPGPTFN
jgi:hypothetical protein